MTKRETTLVIAFVILLMISNVERIRHRRTLKELVNLYDGIIYSGRMTEIDTSSRALTSLKNGDTNKAVRLLETRLDGALWLICTPPFPETNTLAAIPAIDWAQVNAHRQESMKKGHMAHYEDAISRFIERQLEGEEPQPAI